MGLFDKLKEMKARREQKAEEQMINKVANAKDKIRQLEARKKILEDRERTLERSKQLEVQVKGMETKQKNPLMSSLQHNIKAKLAESKKKTKSKPSSNPFTSSSGSSPFLTNLKSDSSRFYLKR